MVSNAHHGHPHIRESRQRTHDASVELPSSFAVLGTEAMLAKDRENLVMAISIEAGMESGSDVF